MGSVPERTELFPFISWFMVPGHTLQELHTCEYLIYSLLCQRPDIFAQLCFVHCGYLRNNHHALFG